MQQIRILLADPQTLFREGLKALLAPCGDIQVALETLDLKDAAAGIASFSPDVVLMEVDRLAAKSIRALRPATRVAFLTSRQDDDALFDYRESGAAGYILKDLGFAELLEAIRAIHRGDNWVSHSLMHRVPSHELKSRQAVLTAREQEVLKMTAEGHSVKEVAVLLDLSAKTVDAHKVNLMRKLRIHNKAQLVHYAFQNQIIKLSFQGV
jgi:two-component system response regulator NreC